MNISPRILCFSFLWICFASQAAAKTPNIIFAISDDQSFPHASIYGTKWVKTPAFDRIAREGLLFMNCYTPNAKCGPSRSIIVTGRNSYQLEQAANHISDFPDKFKSFMEIIRDHTNYVVGHTGKTVSPMKIPKGRQLAGPSWSKAKLKPGKPSMSNNDYAENFKLFMEAKPQDRPFAFWYGCTEPHRGYKYGLGIEKGGKSIDQIDRVPGYWPDNETVRTDMLDYAYEIEHFDEHLGKILSYLEKVGELDNTIIVVTSDNGMPFPRCKGNQYEISNHLPLAIMWPKGIKNPGRKITDYVSFIDFAPTFLDLAGVNDPAKHGMQPMQGKSLRPIFDSSKSGRVEAWRDHVILGQERHDYGRPGEVGYPVRSIIKDGFYYIHNFKPERWPSCNPETGYLQVDGSPTKTTVLEMRRKGESDHYWKLCFGKRPAEELYNLGKDRDCIQNLASNPEYESILKQLKQQLFKELKDQGDPRMFGNGDIFDNYGVAREGISGFYERFMKGEIKKKPGWVNPGDFEPKPLD